MTVGEVEADPGVLHLWHADGPDILKRPSKVRRDRRLGKADTGGELDQVDDPVSGKASRDLDQHRPVRGHPQLAVESADGQVHRVHDSSYVLLHLGHDLRALVSRGQVPDLHEGGFRSKQFPSERDDCRLALRDITVGAELRSRDVLLDDGSMLQRPAQIETQVGGQPVEGRAQLRPLVRTADVDASRGVHRLDHTGKTYVLRGLPEFCERRRLSEPGRPQAGLGRTRSHERLVPHLVDRLRPQADQSQSRGQPGRRRHVKVAAGQDRRERSVPMHVEHRPLQRGLVIGVHHEHVVRRRTNLIRKCAVIGVIGRDDDL